MTGFYTNAFIYKGTIHYTGYENGKRVKKKAKYAPYIFLPSSDITDFKTLDGRYVSKKTFDTIPQANKYIREKKEISNFDFWGNTSFLYTWINDTFPGTIDFIINLISVGTLDIEVAGDQGLPDYRKPVKPITAITVSKNGKKYTFAYGPFETDREDVKYFHCKDEKEMLAKFLKAWEQLDLDVVTGWHVEGFDIPYLYRRLKLLFNEEIANRLSPWGIVEEREIRSGRDKSDHVYDLKGIATLDYLILYKKFTFTSHESYTLNHICSVEIGEKKTDYSDYESLLNLYRQNHQLFIEYNIRDVDLVDKLDAKMGLLAQVFTLSYLGKVNYQDTLTTVRMWDTIIHNYLMDQGIVVPDIHPKLGKSIIGGYVKDVKPGLYKWVISLDYTSLYPHLIMTFNIGPDTFIKMLDIGLTLDEVIDGGLKEYKEMLTDLNAACAANLALYRRDRQGFLAALMEKVYKDRKKHKDLMIEAKKKYEETKDESLKAVIAKHHNMQQALKILLNSAYGAVANEFFRFFDPDNAEAVTASGQMSVRWVEDRVNRWMNKLLGTKGKDYVVAVDTDSVYVVMDGLVKKSGLKETDEIVDFLDQVVKEKLQPFVDKCIEALCDYTNAYENKLSMKQEAIADKGIWTAKKRYILNVRDLEGIRYKEPNLKLTGIEAVRSSTPFSCRENIKKALKIIMNGSNEELIVFIEKFKKEFKEMPLPDIAFPRSVNGMDYYKDSSSIYRKGTPIHVKGSLIYNYMIQKLELDKIYPYIYNSDKIKFISLKTPNPIHNTVISFLNVLPKQFGLEDYIDYDTQFQKAFLDPLQHIVNAIDWKLEDESSLEDFFV